MLPFLQALAHYRHVSLNRESVREALICINHFCALRDTAGPAFVDARNLTKVRGATASAGSLVPIGRLPTAQQQQPPTAVTLVHL